MYNGKLCVDAWSNMTMTHENAYYLWGFAREVEYNFYPNGVSFIRPIYTDVPITVHLVLSRDAIFGVEIRNAYNGNK